MFRAHYRAKIHRLCPPSGRPADHFLPPPRPFPFFLSSPSPSFVAARPLTAAAGDKGAAAAAPKAGAVDPNNPEIAPAALPWQDYKNEYFKKRGYTIASKEWTVSRREGFAVCGVVLGGGKRKGFAAGFSSQRAGASRRLRLAHGCVTFTE